MLKDLLQSRSNTAIKPAAPAGDDVQSSGNKDLQTEPERGPVSEKEKGSAQPSTAVQDVGTTSTTTTTGTTAAAGAMAGRSTAPPPSGGEALSVPQLAQQAESKVAEQIDNLRNPVPSDINSNPDAVDQAPSGAAEPSMLLPVLGGGAGVTVIAGALMFTQKQKHSEEKVFSPNLFAFAMLVHRNRTGRCLLTNHDAQRVISGEHDAPVCPHLYSPSCDALLDDESASELQEELGGKIDALTGDIRELTDERNKLAASLEELVKDLDSERETGAALGESVIDLSGKARSEEGRAKTAENAVSTLKKGVLVVFYAVIAVQLDCHRCVVARIVDQSDNSLTNYVSH